MQLLSHIPERRNTFVETKTISALSTPLEATGTLFYRRPAHFEKVTLRPRLERLVVDGDRLSLASAGEPARVVDLDSHPAIRALVDAVRGTLAGDLDLLRRSYQVQMDGDLAAWRLVLTPADPAVARLVKQVVIEGEQASLRSVWLSQANHDDSRMTISAAP